MRGREVRGAPYSAQWESSTHSGSPDVFRELVGFRLVSDNVTRLYRGGHWDDEPEHAIVASRDCHPPSTNFDFLGFRLVWDRT